MKILFVIRNLNSFGASKILLWLAKELANRNHDIGVLSYAGSSVPHIALNISFFEGNKPPKRKEYYYAFRKIRNTVKEFDPDVIVAFRDNAAILSVIATYKLNKPIVFCERSDPYMETNIMLKFPTPYYKAFVSPVSTGTRSVHRHSQFVKNVLIP